MLCILSITSCTKDKEPQPDIPSPEEQFMDSWNVPDAADGVFYQRLSFERKKGYITRQNGFVARFDTTDMPGSIVVNNNALDYRNIGVAFYQYLINDSTVLGDSVLWQISGNPANGTSPFVIVDTISPREVVFVNLPDTVDVNTDLVINFTQLVATDELTFKLSSSNGALMKIAEHNANSIIITPEEFSTYVKNDTAFSIVFGMKRNLISNYIMGKKYYFLKVGTYRLNFVRRQ